MPNTAKEFRIYRANGQGTGSATSWQLSFKPDEKYNQWMMFLTGAKQTGKDENDNASFDWGNKITVKLGINDIGEFLSVLSGAKNSVGQKGSLFHQTPGGGNKSVGFGYNDQNGGYNLRISAQDKDKNTSYIQQVLSAAEAEVLKALLQRAVVRIYEW
jgi:hypothetical protein